MFLSPRVGCGCESPEPKVGPVPTPLLLLTHGMTVNKSHLGLSLLNCKMGLDTPATLDLTEGDFGEEV